MVKTRKLSVLSTEISIVMGINDDDYICLTDMVKASDDDGRAADIIKNWIRNRSTIEFLGAWETMYNPNFKVVEFDHFRKSAGLPTFTMSVTNWVEETNAIGIYSKSGKYGGTYAHKGIAFEFGTAISPMFKLYLIKDYQRLKEEENRPALLQWHTCHINVPFVAVINSFDSSIFIREGTGLLCRTALDSFIDLPSFTRDNMDIRSAQ